MSVINDAKCEITEDYLNPKAKILRSENYKYIWSLKHLKNSGVKNSLYPNNYITDVKKYIADNPDSIVIVDIDSDDILHQFKESGITFSELETIPIKVEERSDRGWIKTY